MVKATLPVLFTVTVCAVLAEPTFWLVKVKLPGVTPAIGALPVPPRASDCGLPLALSVMLTEAEREPGTVGAKVTLIMQVLPAVTGVPQVLV